MEKMDFLFEKDYLLTGTDPGNIINKITYVNAKGNIESFNIASIIEINAKTTASDLGGGERDSKFPEDMILHVHIKSEALPKNRTNAYYTVGEYAQLSITEETKHNLIETSSDAADKLGNEIHIVTTLTGLALAALKSNKKGKVRVPLSTGLPIEEAKQVTNEKLAVFKGQHEVTMIDGPYKGKTITLVIEDVELNVEGVTSYLALAFDLKNGEIVETDFDADLDNEFAIADLGAGTFDLALYDENGLNPNKSTSKKIGANTFIDKIMTDIVNMEEFKIARERAINSGIEPKISSTREEFMRKFIKPVMDRFIEDSDKSEEPVFKVKWQGKEVNASEIVINHMKEYAEEVSKEINRFFVSANIGTIIIVGGGLLFAYPYLMKLSEQGCYFPTNLKESSYFTSKAYLLKSINSQRKKLTVNA